jgi:hypothetical protein
MNDTYFAARETEELIAALKKKSKDHYTKLHSNKYLDNLKRLWRAYHGLYGDDNNAHEISFVGEQGELVSIPVNHFRNIAKHIYNMITATRPVMEARAVNTDYKSLSQTYLANSILEYYMREKGLENCIKIATEYAVVLGCGFVRVEWNETAGKLVHEDEESGAKMYEGDLEFSNLSPFDVVHDGTKDSWSNDWLIVRSKRNKFDLAAKYPEQAEKIKKVQTVDQIFGKEYELFSNDDTDDVYIFEFFHRRTESMPEGRYCLYLDDDIALVDQGLPYRVMPVFRISAGEILGTPYAYSPMSDLYPIQEAINATYSTILTNQTAFGIPNVYIPDGSNISISTVAGGLNLVQGQAKPELIQMDPTPKEVFDFLGMLIQAQETLSGINSVIRGQPEASLRSASALSLIQSQAIQYISHLEQSYVKLIEDVGSNVVEILKDFARSPKLVTLVGKYNRTYLKEFTGEDLDAISRVIVDVGNALSRTIAGRVQMAEQMAQMGLLKTPQQYFMVVNTGRLDSAFEGDMAELLNIKKENENLMTGATVRAVAWDAHRMHILEHRSVLADPDLRQSEEVKKAVSEHIQEHIDLLRIIDPDVLMLMGEQPLTPMDQLLGMGQPQPMPGPMAPGEQQLTPGPSQPAAPENPEASAASYSGSVPPIPGPVPPGGMGNPQ